MLLFDEEEKELDELSALIMQELVRFQDIFAPYTNEAPAQNLSEEWRKHNFTMIAFRSRRMSILMRCPWMEDYWVEQQLAELLENVKALYGKEAIDPDVLSDALDSLRAVADGSISDERFLSLLPRRLRRKARRRPRQEFSPVLASLLSGVAEVWFARSETKRASKILHYLVEVSQVRNAGDPEKHGELVAFVLSRLVERDWEAAASVCDSEASYFVDREDDAAGDYLWFRAGIKNHQQNIPAAKIGYAQCYQLRRKLYGEKDWYTSLARFRWAILSMSSENAEEHLPFFIRFVHDIRDGSITGPDQRMLHHEEGSALYYILLYQNKIHIDHEFMTYWRLFEELCKEYNETSSEALLKLRLCYNLLGQYYFLTGNFLQAEQAFLEALNAPFPDETEEIITEAQIASSLLMIYHAENDLAAALPLLERLLELVGEGDLSLTEQDRYRIWGLQASILMQMYATIEEDVVREIKSRLDKMERALQNDFSAALSYRGEHAAFAVTSILLLLNQECLNCEERRRYEWILHTIHDQCAPTLERAQTGIVELLLSILALDRGDQSAESYILDSIMKTERSWLPEITQSSVYLTAATILIQNGKMDKARSFICRSLEKISNVWQSDLRYLNDQRLVQVLESAQLQFLICYSRMRMLLLEDKELYELVLRYKALASLAGKERNRILLTGAVDPAAAKRMRAVQDRLALIMSGALFQEDMDEEKVDKELFKLRKLEAQYGAMLPQTDRFVTISLDALVGILPEHAIVIEYYYCSDGFETDLSAEDADPTVFDVFVLKKEARATSLRRFVIHGADQILDDAVEFLDIFLDESSGRLTLSQMDRKEFLRSSLYERLIQPLIAELPASGTIYLAPDGELINLPFELLCDEDDRRFGDRYVLVRMECARDFLFGGDNGAGKGALVLGDPKYRLREQRNAEEPPLDGPSARRLVSLRTEDIRPLPFSGVEAELIGQICGVPWYTGAEATRARLLESRDLGMLHLATHGFYDREEQTHSIYSASLLLAGAKDWVETGREDPICGSGLVSADEISRLDLHGLELATLSACLSGMNENVTAKGFQGLIGGLSAAGARYVVSSQWYAADLASMLLMTEFYKNYHELRQSPPEALDHAKEYVRTATVGDLEACGWFDALLRRFDPDSEAAISVRNIRSKGRSYLPFAKEVYWAGFTCSRCNQ